MLLYFSFCGAPLLDFGRRHRWFGAFRSKRHEFQQWGALGSYCSQPAAVHVTGCVQQNLSGGERSWSMIRFVLLHLGKKTCAMEVVASGMIAGGGGGALRGGRAGGGPWGGGGGGGGGASLRVERSDRGHQ